MKLLAGAVFGELVGVASRKSRHGFDGADGAGGVIAADVDNQNIILLVTAFVILVTIITIISIVIVIAAATFTLLSFSFSRFPGCRLCYSRVCCGCVYCSDLMLFHGADVDTTLWPDVDTVAGSQYKLLCVCVCVCVCGPVGGCIYKCIEAYKCAYVCLCWHHAGMLMATATTAIQQ